MALGFEKKSVPVILFILLALALGVPELYAQAAAASAGGAPAAADTSSAASVSADELAAELGMDFHWDPYRLTGTFSGRGHWVSFILDFPFLMVDSRFLLPLRDTRRDPQGMIRFSPQGAAQIRRVFSGFYDRRAPIIAAVVLDPGHGGRDPGAVGTFTIDGQRKQFREKDVALTVGREIYRRLTAAYPDRQIILTRSDDTYLTLEERTAIANKVVLEDNEAMIFVSIHANASLNASASGFEVWYLPADYRRDLLSPGDVEGVDDKIIPILDHLLDEEFTVESISLARMISDGLTSSLGSRSRNRGLKAESWFVVRNAKMPSVLIEMGFITNREEALRMQDPAYLKDMAQGIYNGINSFIEGFESTKGFTE